MEYRRAKTPGGTYFFTVVTYQRQTIFDDAEMVDLLRDCFRLVKQRHPFVIEAIAVLREHLHCIWTLPEGDADFSMRWRLIKGEFSRRCGGAVQTETRGCTGEEGGTSGMAATLLGAPNSG